MLFMERVIDIPIVALDSIYHDDDYGPLKKIESTNR
jgi:hypothetical protein